MAKITHANLAPNTEYVDMPLLGLRQLATQQYPDDAADPTTMEAHVQRLWLLNQDTLANPDAYTAGQQVLVFVATSTTTKE